MKVIYSLDEARASAGFKKDAEKLGISVDELHKAKYPELYAAEKPKTHNDVLDTPENIKAVDLLTFLDDDHLLKKLCSAVAAAYCLPESTVFLMAVAVFSSVACRKFVVNYLDGGCLPIGLYAISEQPSGVGKTRCLNFFLHWFCEIHTGITEDRKAKINRLLTEKELKEALDEDDQQELLNLQNNPVPLLYTTNTTPAGLEKTLASNKGFFAAISSEQGMFNSLFSQASNGGVVNNDVVLNGFDAGYININRGARDGYSGNVTGAIVCFAQQGSIETILDASNGSGLSERFLMLVEPHLLGKRDHTKPITVPNELILEYKKVCHFALDVFTNPDDCKGSSHLSISKEGFDLIAEYKNAIEPHLADGGKYSFPALRGVASKINMQIMKIAANLHLMDQEYFLKSSPTIADRHIESAIRIADRLLQHQLKMMRDKGIIGIKAEWQAILDAFDKDRELTERKIIERKRKVKPFVGMSNPNDNIRKCIADMQVSNLLESFPIGEVIHYRLGQ